MKGEEKFEKNDENYDFMVQNLFILLFIAHLFFIYFNGFLTNDKFIS